MILHPQNPSTSESTDDQSLLAITQTDHAWLSAEMYKLFVDPSVHEHPRFPALLRAARRHDDGWMGIDAAPRLHPDGNRPHDFRSIARLDREEVWTRTYLDLESPAPTLREAWASALILQHAMTLHGGANFRSAKKKTDGAVVPDSWVLSTELLERLATARDSHLATAARSPEFDHEQEQAFEVLCEDYGYLALVDWLSLVACMGIPTRFECHGYQGEVRPEDEVTRLLLNPFPFHGATTWQVPAREIPLRRYEGDANLAVALASAKYTKRAIRAEPQPTIQTVV